MITEEIIRQSFIDHIVRRDANIIYTTQAKVVNDNFSDGTTSRLAAFLSNKPFSAQDAPGGRQNYYFRVFTYLRFLDIRHSGRGAMMQTRRRLALYNRVIWGVLYHETLPDLRYGLTEDMRKMITEQLQQPTT